MELNEFIANFAEQFDDTDALEIKANTNYKELDEWSSLISMSVISMSNIKYGKTLTGTEIRTCTTVEDLYNLIATK